MSLGRLGVLPLTMLRAAGWRDGWVPAAVASLLMLVAGPAGALSITLAGPTSGPLAGGVGLESAPGAQITFVVALDATSVSLNGYDVSVAWDAGELAFVSALDLSGLGFDTAPVGAASAGERVAALELAPVVTGSLFQITFQVLGASVDGLADFSVFVDALQNGAGLAPGSLALANPSGAAIDVPEPAGLLALALLVGCGCRRWLQPGKRA